MTVELWALIAGLFAAIFLLSGTSPAPAASGMWRRVPEFPGPLNQLVRKNLREILSTLDFYCAADPQRRRACRAGSSSPDCRTRP